ncbi:MAG: DNA-directed RNA polymerases II 24 kDa polypeptide (RNA polymerase II subunit 5) [Cirrosporium novae-zelandiae]|nr:MAG: DNA-directed RNA polymerases II 24 kDa polypeptide (RNA polymerase II subunit 5) [Cirrosporium novae-zelandiae]
MDSEKNKDAERMLVKLWRAWRTSKEMCLDRGYELSEEEVSISLDQFRNEYSDPLGYPDRSKMKYTARPSEAMIKKHTPLPTVKNPDPAPDCGTIWVEFSHHDSIGIKQMRDFCQLISRECFHTGILVTQQTLTAAALKIIPAVLPSVIEVFREDDLLVNITRHELVPKHVLLSAEEKKALLERYRLKESQLPRIQVGDPVSKYLGLKRGEIVKIIRRSETAGRYASYRWVI